MIYLDHNSTTAISKPVLEKMNEVYLLNYINPSAVHGYGAIAKKLLLEAKARILCALNATDEYDCLFTSSATEANNLALNGKVTVTTKTEHESILNAPFDTIFIDVNNRGLIEIESLRACATEGRVVSIIWASNQTGVVQNMKEIMINKGNCLLHTDATQYIGKQYIDLSITPLDALTFCGHKIHGPQGIGCLVFKKSFPVQKMIYGGSQENGIRGGTYNLPAIVGLSYAVLHANNNKYLTQYKLHTGNLIEEIVQFIIKKGGIVLPSHNEKVSNTICLAKPGILNSEQVMIMDFNGICVSVGSACSAGISKTKNHVLQAMNISDDISSCAIRVSLGMENTQSDIAKFCSVWANM